MVRRVYLNCLIRWCAVDDIIRGNVRCQFVLLLKWLIFVVHQLFVLGLQGDSVRLLRGREGELSEQHHKEPRSQVEERGRPPLGLEEDAQNHPRLEDVAARLAARLVARCWGRRTGGLPPDLGLQGPEGERYQEKQDGAHHMPSQQEQGRSETYPRIEDPQAHRSREGAGPTPQKWP